MAVTGTEIRLGPLGWLRWGWRQLTTMRVALWLLLALGLATIPGSVFPQRTQSPLKVNEYLAENPVLGPWIDRLGGFDVYGSVWFSAIYLLLMVSLVGCIVPRLRLQFAELRRPLGPLPRDLNLADLTFRYPTDQPDAQLAGLTAALPRSWRRRTATGELAAERGQLRQIGNLIFHMSLVGVLVAVAVGALFGYRGQVIVREGSRFSNVLAQYDSFSAGRLFQPDQMRPFAVELRDLQVDFTSQDGAGKAIDFRAEVGYQELDADCPDCVTSQSVGVNNPLNVGGASLFLIGHGYAPHFQVWDRDGVLVFDDTVVFLPQDGNFTSTGVVKVPDMEPQLGLDGIFAPTGVIDEMLGPHSVYPDLLDPMVYASAWVGDLGMDNGVAQNVYTLDKTKLTNLGLEELAPGDTWELPDGNGTVKFVGIARFATFNVGNDPGQNFALLFALIAILGILAALYVQPHYLWVRRMADGLEIGISGPRAERDAAWLRAQLGGGIELVEKSAIAPEGETVD